MDIIERPPDDLRPRNVDNLSPSRALYDGPTHSGKLWRTQLKRVSKSPKRLETLTLVSHSGVRRVMTPG